MIIVIALLVVISIKFYLFLKDRNEKFRKVENIPSPKSYPIVGTLIDNLFIPRDKIFERNREYTRTLGPIFKHWAFNDILIELSDHKNMEVVLSSMKHIEKGIVYNFLHSWLGTGLLTSTGTKWQKRRKLLTPAFHWNILQEFQEVFNRETDNLVEMMRNECDQPHTKINALISQFTLHSITETAMAYKLDVSPDTAKKYKESIYKLGELFVNRIVKIWFYNDALYKITSEGKEFEKHVKLLHKFTNNVIEERKDTLNLDENKFNPKKKTRALLDLLLSAQKNKNEISDEGIREEVDTFTFEGQDTTYTAICFLLLNLANYPDVQEKVYKEIMTVLEDNPPTTELLNKLTYTEMCIKESLRIYPSVPTVVRKINEDIHLPSGHIVPGGSMLKMNFYDMHRNPEIFPDPEKYDPERFSAENTKNRHPFAYLPFSAGPRNCIGQKFAMLEIKTALAGILRNFKLEAVDKPEDLVFVSDLILRTKNDIKIKLIPRN